MIYLKQPANIGITEVYMAVRYDDDYACDSCCLQADCHALFENGDKCEAISMKPKHRWVRIPDEDIERIRK